MSWTDERVELLKKLWTDGLSASQIASSLGEVTRNAVIGKIHRLGLSGRVRPAGAAPVVAAAPAMVAAPAVRRAPKQVAQSAPRPPARRLPRSATPPSRSSRPTWSRSSPSPRRGSTTWS